MSRYIATFHTHLSALLTCQRLTAAGVRARMMPVPRKLSASCGTCVDYEASVSMRSPTITASAEWQCSSRRPVRIIRGLGLPQK